MKCFLCIATWLFCATATVSAQTYPNKTITMIVPFAAGGTSDVIARLIAEQMSQALDQRVVIENVPGAGGSTAFIRVARSMPDGYTIAIGNTGTNTAVYTIYPDVKFTVDDFIAVAMVAKTVPIIALKKDFPVSDLRGFIDYAKKNPGKVTLGHAGVGSSNYLICKAFAGAAKIDVTLVGYRGAGPALNDLMAGSIDGVCDSAPSVGASIQSGLTKGLVIVRPARLPSLPAVPTAVEAGLPEFSLAGWNAIFVPKGTPEPVIATLNAAIRKGVANERYLKRLEDLATLPPSSEEMTPQYMRAFVPHEIEKFRELLADADKDKKDAR
jgi:tripartite-type tricarboxylate transporter receptor subunit TctC